METREQRISAKTQVIPNFKLIAKIAKTWVI